MIPEIGKALKVADTVLTGAMKAADGVEKIGKGVEKLTSEFKEVYAKVKNEVDQLPRQIDGKSELSDMPKELDFEDNQDELDTLDDSIVQRVRDEVDELPKEMDFFDEEEMTDATELPKEMDFSDEEEVAEETDNKVDSNPESEDKQFTIKEKQEIADKAAQDYNAKTNPYERAMAKGIEGVTKTDNGGVSFAETDRIYKTEDGTKCITKITATGDRQKDFDAANAAMGLKETPENYVWHHLDDYNVEDGTITLELVDDEAHNASKPHSGGCAQYDAANGASYNPARKGV